MMTELKPDCVQEEEQILSMPDFIPFGMLHNQVMYTRRGLDISLVDLWITQVVGLYQMALSMPDTGKGKIVSLPRTP